jgi:hypothetical protein
VEAGSQEEVSWSFCVEAIFIPSSKFEMSLSLLANEITPGDAPDCSVSALVMFSCSDVIGSGSDEAPDCVVLHFTGSVSDGTFFAFLGGMG